MAAVTIVVDAVAEIAGIETEMTGAVAGKIFSRTGSVTDAGVDTRTRTIAVQTKTPVAGRRL